MEANVSFTLQPWSDVKLTLSTGPPNSLSKDKMQSSLLEDFEDAEIEIVVNMTRRDCWDAWNEVRRTNNINKVTHLFKLCCQNMLRKLHADTITHKDATTLLNFLCCNEVIKKQRISQDSMPDSSTESQETALSVFDRESNLAGIEDSNSHEFASSDSSSCDPASIATDGYDNDDDDVEDADKREKVPSDAVQYPLASENTRETLEDSSGRSLENCDIESRGQFLTPTEEQEAANQKQSGITAIIPLESPPTVETELQDRVRKNRNAVGFQRPAVPERDKTNYAVRVGKGIEERQSSESWDLVQSSGIFYKTVESSDLSEEQESEVRGNTVESQGEVYCKVPNQETQTEGVGLTEDGKNIEKGEIAIKVEDEDSFSSGKSKVFTCVTCKGTFMTKTKLLNHEKVHRAQKTQVGKNRKSLQSDNGRVETQQNVNNGKGKVCEEEVRKKLDHDTCHSGFDPASKPARHVKQRAKKLHCDQCDKTFDAKHRLRDHQRTHTGERPYCCDKCGKAFHSKDSLRKHGPTHSDKIFPCEICGRKFNRKASVRLHMRRHTGGNIDKRKKPFCCKQCGKSFHRNSLLTWHMNTHTGDKPYQCDICRRCFHYETSLKFHIQRHSQGKAFKCSVCSKSFFARSDLVCHVRMHTGEKPFQCEHCGKCFSRSYGLYSHMRRHKNTQPAAVH